MKVLSSRVSRSALLAVVVCSVAVPGAASAATSAAPDVPSSLTIGGAPCVDGGVTYLRAMTSSPSMSAVVNDPDGSNVRARFLWNEGSDVYPTPTRTDSAYVASGSRASAPLPIAVDGTVPSGTWSFRAVAEDSTGARSAVSAKCTVTIDTTPPSTPRITAVPEQWESGTPATVELSPAKGKGRPADTAGYAVTIDDDQAPTAKAYTPTTASKVMDVTLPEAGRPALQPGLHTLRVWAYDRAGNRSATPALLDFEVVGRVGGPPAQRSTYDFEGSDSAAGNDSTGAFPLSIGTAERTTRVLVTDGVDVYARDRMLSLSPSTTTLPRVSGALVSPAGSFSIAGFFDPAASPVRTMTAVTLRGSGSARFAELGVAPDGDGYAYVFKVWDAIGQTWAAARLSGEDTVPGTALVVATYDPADKTLTLSMPDHGTESSATLAGEAPASLPGQQLLLGAGAAGGSRWLGGLDELVVAQVALSSSEVGDLVARHETEECFESEFGCG